MPLSGGHDVELRYGINPQQMMTDVRPVEAGSWPIRLLNGEPSYINLLDALNGWQLVHEASQALGKPAAASFKHVSPAGAAVAGPVDEVMVELYGIGGSAVGNLTSAYLRARDADPKSSYGDFAAVSDPVDDELAELLMGVVCDGIVAPGYAPSAVRRLSQKRKGCADGPLPATAVEDLLLGLAVLRYTQANSVCYVRADEAIGTDSDVIKEE